MYSKSSISFDSQPLKQSILANAAKISPHIRETTIGPNAEVSIPGEEVSRPTVGGGEEPPVLPESTEEVPESNFTSHINFKEYFDDISHIRRLQNFERQRKEAIQKEVQMRLSRQRIQQTDREAIYSECQKSLQRKLCVLYDEAERRVRLALEEQEQLGRDQEEMMRAANIKRTSTQQMKLKQFREKQEMSSFIKALGKAQEKFVKCFETFARTLLSIEKSIMPNYKAFNEKAQPLLTTYHQTLHAIATEGISEARLVVIEGLVEQFQKLQQELLTRIATDAAEAEEKRQKAETEKPVDQPDARNVQGMNQFISPECQKHYTRVMNLLVEYSTAIEPLSRDETLKKYRFNCQKAINIPVNAISGVSAAHLKDKFDKLATLLSGNPVPCGDEQVSAAAHPLGKKFCTVLLARKFVNQADTMVASNPKAAFPIASVILALWQRFPDFGHLFLAHTYRECPYLVPYFIPQFEGQSTDDYCRVLGYKIVNGAQEPQDMYLKRMAGIARLYAAVLITRPRQGEQTHPHDLNNAWVWLCNVLNMDPLPDICATMLLEVLQTVGEELRRVYGKQFLKLIFVIQSQYFAKLKLVDEGGPRARLEVLLAKVMKEGRFERPEGVLQPNFW